jgi:hypothetical protein
MANYQLTNRAVADLTQIWNYTLDNWSENQADRYYKMLIDHLICLILWYDIVPLARNHTNARL